MACAMKDVDNELNKLAQYAYKLWNAYPMSEEGTMDIMAEDVLYTR